MCSFPVWENWRIRLSTVARFCRMIVEVSQLDADVGCGDVYMMTATDRGIEPTLTCGWDGNVCHRWTGMTIDFWLSQMEAMRWEVQMYDKGLSLTSKHVEALCPEELCWLFVWITLCSFFDGLKVRLELSYLSQCGEVQAFEINII